MCLRAVFCREAVWTLAFLVKFLENCRVKKFFLQTFGCQQNINDSERVASILENAGFVETENMTDADVIIFNTCSVRKHAEDRAFGFLREAHRLRKEKPRQIGLTGCMARQTSTRDFEKQDKLLKKCIYLDFVFRIEDAPKLSELLNKKEVEVCGIGENLQDLFAVTPKLQKHYSAFVPIMSGCNKFCTYCIVPYTRGREQSRSFAEIKKECENLVAKGATEITLLGQNVNAYFLDDSERSQRGNQTDFAWLLHEIAKISGVKRLRFTSPHPSQMGFDVIDVMAEHDNICKLLHLPVQAGSDEILRAMNRSHTRADFQKITAYAREKMPNLAISTDIIVGFPGETEENFAETLDLCKQEEFDMVYIAKFSPRQGTAAAKMEDDVLWNEKKKRFHALNDVLRKSSLKRNLVFVGQKHVVLIEEIQESGKFGGKTEQGKIVYFDSDEDLVVGDYVEVEIKKANNWFLEG